MVRTLRIEYAGAIYHVIQRGNNREYVFEEDMEKAFLLKQLKDFKEPFGFKLLGYVIMDNHYHLILKTDGEPLRKIMHRLNSNYGKFYNSRHERVGHVFQGPYKASIVKDERYLLALLGYIHGNPVRAQICDHPKNYKWSSDKFYRQNSAGFVDIDFALDVLSENRCTAINEYIALIDQAQDGLERTEEFVLSPHQTQDTVPATKKSLEEIFQAAVTDPRDRQLIMESSRKRHLTALKLEYIRLCLTAGYSLKEAGGHIGLTEPAVSLLLQRKMNQVDNK